MLMDGKQEEGQMSRFVTESGRVKKSFGYACAISMLSLALSATCGISYAADDVDALIEKAYKMMQADKNKPAETLLRDALRGNPDNAKLHMVLGKNLAAQATAVRPDQKKQIEDLYETAILEENQALKLDPKLFGAHVALGQIYANLGKSEQSIAEMKQACAIRPTSYGAHRDLGIACLTSGKIDEAIEAFKKATTLKPEQPEAHMKLAILLSKRNNVKDALNEAAEAAKLAPKDPETHIALGNIMLESGDANGSIEPFKTALSIAKNHPNALSGYGLAIVRKDPAQLAQGIDYQRKALSTSGGAFLPAYVRLAEFLYASGKPVEAEEQYKKALKINPDDAGVGTAYGKFLEAAGRKEDARAALKKVLEKSPHFKPASDALAGLDQPNSPKTK